MANSSNPSQSGFSSEIEALVPSEAKFKIPAFAKTSGIPAATLYKMARRGDLPCLEVSGYWLIRETIIRWLVSRQKGGAA